VTFRTALHSVLHTILRGTVIASIVTIPAGAQGGEQLPTLVAQGSTSLSRAGHATRVHLLGSVEIYTVGVYVEGATSDRQRLLSPDVSKALRIEIRYTEDLHRRVPFDWRRELIPVLEPAATAHLRGVFAPLTAGDVVLIEYVPWKGTAVRVNDATAVSGAKHELMMAFLDHWLGQRPVSEEMKRTLVGPS
jgi:Chalcone isomerase-like